MRFFIALEVPLTNRGQFRYIQNKLQELIPEVKLTDNSKLHLTIAFIGEQPEELKTRLIEVLNIAALDIPTFEVSPGYIDAFPTLHQPRTFWVGVKDEVDKLFILEERIKDQLINLKLSVDNRRYVPHVAIGKINRDFKVTPRVEESLQKIIPSHRFDPIIIDSIKLFESIPSQGFHMHNTLAEIKLS